MPYSLALTAGAQAQNEGNPGGAAATWTYTLTRSGADINGGAQTYSYAIRNTDTSLSNDFATAPSGTNTFVWAGGATTTTVTFTADPDIVVEGNEAPVIWFYSTSSPSGVQILSNQDIAGNVITLTNDDTGVPVFSSSATMNFAENGTAVGTVTATAGGTAVTYAKTGGADQALFTVDANTGVITVTSQNFEAPGDVGTDRNYNLQITATAGGATKVQDLVLTLTNANEAPVITGGAGPIATSVAENIALVPVTQAYTDVDVGDTITWSISGGPDAARFTINASTGALSFATPADFENPADVGANNVYNVTLRATDAGGLFAEQTHDVTVTNADDPAVISSYGGARVLIISAPENTATSTTLATVVAADQDTGGLAYTLTGPDAARFSLAGGVLTFNPSPDFELPGDANLDNVYDVTVQAQAGGSGAATQQFLVFVTNVVEPGESGGGGGGFVLPTPPAPPAPPAPGAGDDSIMGSATADIRDGGAGSDTIDGAGGDDSLDGGTGDDDIYGGDGNDFIRGLNDDDYVTGGLGNDTVNGNLGQDYVEGGAGADVVYGGQGNDEVFGGDGDDSYVNGNIGNDTVHGDNGADSVYGGQNDDIIYGDDGNDLLSGDLGNDLMYGGAGADRFTTAPGGGNDWVIDFNGTAGDRIQLAAGTTYSIGAYQGQVLITVGGSATIGLAGVSFFDPNWVVFS